MIVSDGGRTVAVHGEQLGGLRGGQAVGKKDPVPQQVLSRACWRGAAVDDLLEVDEDDLLISEKHVPGSEALPDQASLQHRLAKPSQGGKDPASAARIEPP